MKIRLDLDVERMVRAIRSKGNVVKGNLYRLKSVIDRHDECCRVYLSYNGIACNNALFIPRFILQIDKLGYCDPSLFEEIKDSKIMKVVSSVKEGYPIKVVIRFNGPRTVLFRVASEPAVVGAMMLAELAVGDVITVGRHGDICLNSRGEAFSNYISRLHCFVYRESAESFVLVSCSPNSTSLF